MIGRDEYRLAVAHWKRVIRETTAWPSLTGLERAPFVEAPYRHAIDDAAGIPSGGADRQFQILVTSIGPFAGVNTVAGTTIDKDLTFSVTVAYHVGADEQETRALAAQDAEAITQRLRHPENYNRTSDFPTGIMKVGEDGKTAITRVGDRIVATIPMVAWMRITLESAQGAAA